VTLSPDPDPNRKAIPNYGGLRHAAPRVVPEREALLMSGGIPMDWHNPKGRRGLTFIPMVTLQRGPSSGFAMILSDCWWSVHPMLGAILAGGNPQANRDRAITEHIIRDLYPGATAQFVHKAIVPIDIRDYA
jgi:hypothetical protein